MCGDSHLPPAPESSDLIAVIYPVSNVDLPSQILPNLSVPGSDASIFSASSLTCPPSTIHGRLRFSNCRSGYTVSKFSRDDSSTTAIPGARVRIHVYGSSLQLGDPNPIMHEFKMSGSEFKEESIGFRLDLGVGGNGVVGRAVSIVDWKNRIVGEGIVGRVRC